MVDTMSTSEGQFDIIKAYEKYVQDENMSTPVAIFKAFTDFVAQSTEPTISNFMETLKRVESTVREDCATESPTRKNQHMTPIAALAGVDLFMRFVERSVSDYLPYDKGTKGARSISSADDTLPKGLEEFKENLVSRANLILDKASTARMRTAEIGAQFVQDDAVILVHAYSRVIMGVLLHAATKQNKRFKVYVTEGRPNNGGFQAAEALREAGIPCRTILDSAVGYIMDRVDMVLVGAEGVVENGGVINQIGTYQIALVAKALNKPVYVVAESYKFVRVFPLNQYDLPSATPDIVTFSSRNQSHSSNNSIVDDNANDLALSNPSVDYTPPQYFTLLLTDLGVLTPSGVSDELIKLYL